MWAVFVWAGMKDEHVAVLWVRVLFLDAAPLYSEAEGPPNTSFPSLVLELKTALGTSQESEQHSLPKKVGDR